MVDLKCLYLDVRAIMGIKVRTAQNAFVLSVEHGATKRLLPMWPTKQRNAQTADTAIGRRAIVSAWRVSPVPHASGWLVRMTAVDGGCVKRCGCSR